MSEPVNIIHPPPDLKGIIDRTAAYVAKNGSAFEAKIIHEQQGKPRFSFLSSKDPFNAYYKHKVSEIRKSLLENDGSSAAKGDSKDKHDGDNKVVGDENNSGTVETNADRQDEADEESNLNQVKPQLNEYIQEKTINLEEPPPLNYLASPASMITHNECNLIKLTSQFIATHGRSFLLELVSREQNNSFFDFLKPQHGQFPYMTNLVMQYALIQNPPLDMSEQLEKDGTVQKHILDRIKMRAEWIRMLELEKKKREEAEESEKNLYNQIDWHDFVVVETVDYQIGDKGEYPPTTADQVGTRLLKQQRFEDHSNLEEMEIDMDMESDQESDVDKEKRDVTPPTSTDSSRIIIRKDYDPKAASRADPSPGNYFVSPITNERIPVDQIHEHVRYNLADPRYLEKKKQILQSRMTEEDVLASGTQIQDSLKNLAERRTDIFGTNHAETVIGQRIGEEGQPRDEKVIWDGHESSLKKKKFS